MPTAQFDRLIAQAERLSTGEKIRLLKRLLAFLELEADLYEMHHLSSLLDGIQQTESIAAPPTDWKTFLQETYGILADDPIRRWPEGGYEERDAIE